MPISYTDKVQLTPNPVADVNQWKAVDANEVKSVVNGLETTVTNGLAARVPTSRILTIDGVPFDLSSDRSWTTSGGTDKFPTIYNVTQNGLVGDGTTDNSAALIALVAAAPAGSTLYFETGTYRVDSSIVINKTLHLVGDGVSHSIITTAANITLLNYDNGLNTPIFSVRLFNIAITNTSGAPTSSAIGLRSDHGGRWTVRNVNIGGFYKNIQLVNVTLDSWTDVYCYSYAHTGMERINSSPWVDSGDGMINSCWFVTSDLYNATYSIFQENGGGLKIVNSKFNHGGGGFKAQYHYYYNGTDNTVDLQISNCSFENWSTAAIRVGVSGGATFHDVTIVGNEIGGTSQNGSDGIIMVGIHDGTIVGNALRANAGSGTLDAITLTNCDNFIIYNEYDSWTNILVNSGSTNINSPLQISSFLVAANDDFIQLKAGVWTNRTIAQVQSDLGIAGSVAITGTDTLDNNDLNKTILCSGTSADYAIALPTAVGITGSWYDFVGVAGLTKIVTVNANGTETINGLTVDRPFTGRGGFKIVSDGANWQVVSEKPSWIVYVPGTFTGVSGTPGGTIKYSLMGKQMTINYQIASTAASGTGLTFTIPSGYNIVSDSTQYAQVMSNSAFVSTGCALVGPGAPTIVSLFLNGAGGAISSAGNKAAVGIVVFEIQ